MEKDQRGGTRFLPGATAAWRQHQSLELTRPGCQSGSALILMNSLEINNSPPPKEHVTERLGDSAPQ